MRTSAVGSDRIATGTGGAAARPPSRAVRRKWTEALDDLGAHRVRLMLDDVALIGGGLGARVRGVDIGLIHGADRYPTRGFVETWLGDPDDGAAERDAQWRLWLAILAAAVLIGNLIALLV